MVMRDLDLDPKRYPPRSFSHQVSNLKNELVDEETFASRVSDAPTRSGCWRRAYTGYQRRLRQANALDFDDLIMTTVNILQVFPEVAEHYRRRFRHVLSSTIPGHQPRPVPAGEGARGGQSARYAGC